MHHGAALAQGSTEEKDGAPRPSGIDRLRENGETATWHARASGQPLRQSTNPRNGQVSRCPRADFYGQQRLSLPSLRTCEKITKCRVAAGFLAWPRREGVGNTRSGVGDALHRPAGYLRQAVSLRSAVPPEQRQANPKRHATLWVRAQRFLIFSQVLRLRIEKRVQSSYLSP